MKFLNYTQHHVTQADKDAVMAVLESDRLTQGPTVELVEAKLCEMTGAKYAVVVNSGTAALHLAFSVVSEHIVGMSAITFVATANALRMLGREPVFFDVNKYTGRPTHEPNIGVTLGGVPCRGEVVDACHGPLEHMAEQVTCFSFHPAKHCAAGEGGAAVTNDPNQAHTMRVLRDHGRNSGRFGYGYNYRMNEMSAALLLSQLGRYMWSVLKRQQIAARYDRAFKDYVDVVDHGKNSARHLYQLLVPLRGFVQAQLKAKGVGTAVHYPAMCSFPGAEFHADHTVSIPMFPTMTTEQVDHVIKSVLEVV